MDRPEVDGLGCGPAWDLEKARGSGLGSTEGGTEGRGRRTSKSLSRRRANEERERIQLIRLRLFKRRDWVRGDSPGRVMFPDDPEVSFATRRRRDERSSQSSRTDLLLLPSTQRHRLRLTRSSIYGPVVRRVGDNRPLLELFLSSDRKLERPVSCRRLLVGVDEDGLSHYQIRREEGSVDDFKNRTGEEDSQVSSILIRSRRPEEGNSQKYVN